MKLIPELITKSMQRNINTKSIAMEETFLAEAISLLCRYCFDFIQILRNDVTYNMVVMLLIYRFNGTIKTNLKHEIFIGN